MGNKKVNDDGWKETCREREKRKMSGERMGEDGEMGGEEAG